MSRQKGDTDIVMGAKSMCHMYYFFIYLAQHGECRELLVTLRISPQEVGQELSCGPPPAVLVTLDFVLGLRIQKL